MSKSLCLEIALLKAASCTKMSLMFPEDTVIGFWHTCVTTKCFPCPECFTCYHEKLTHLSSLSQKGTRAQQCVDWKVIWIFLIVLSWGPMGCVHCSADMHAQWKFFLHRLFWQKIWDNHKRTNVDSTGLQTGVKRSFSQSCWDFFTRAATWPRAAFLNTH